MWVWLSNLYLDYDAREVALYLTRIVNAQALEYRRHPVIWILDQDQFVRIMAAAGLHEAAVKMLDETAVSTDGLANELCCGFCEFPDVDVNRFACRC